MVKATKTSEVKAPPALDPKERENQLINLAVNLAEKQLADGTAPPSIVAHYLRLASDRERLEREILSKQAELISSKAEAIQLQKDSVETAQAAIEAMKSYGSSSK